MSKCINIRLEGSGTEIQRPDWDFRGPTSLVNWLRSDLEAEVSVSVRVLVTSEDGAYLVVRYISHGGVEVWCQGWLLSSSLCGQMTYLG